MKSTEKPLLGMDSTSIGKCRSCSSQNFKGALKSGKSRSRNLNLVRPTAIIGSISETRMLPYRRTSKSKPPLGRQSDLNGPRAR